MVRPSGKTEMIAANIARARANSGTTNPASETAAQSSQTSSARSENSAPEILRYPFTKLDKSDDYMKIEIFDFIPPGLDINSNPNGVLRLRTSDETTYEPGKTKLHATIILPIPEGITDSNAASWEAGGLNPIASTIGQVTNEFLKGAETADIRKSFSGAVDTIKQKLESAGKGLISESGKGVISAYTAGLVSNVLTGSSVGAFLGRAGGLSLNPNQQLLFNSTVGRSFNFGWDIVPRSKKESDEVKKILRALKQNMAPTRDSEYSVGGLFLKSPKVFKVQYMSGAGEHPFLNRFKTMALTAMSVNYTGSNTYATYDDSTPVHMQLSLGFAELTAIYSGDYEGVGGVGY